MWVDHEGRILSEGNIIIYMLFPEIIEIDHEVESWK